MGAYRRAARRFVDCWNGDGGWDALLSPYVSQAGADTVITFDSFHILTLANINAGTLAADDFLFV